MHTYRKTKNKQLWTVGYCGYDVWVPLRDFASEELAAAYANYLNGGTGEFFARI